MEDLEAAGHHTTQVPIEVVPQHAACVGLKIFGEH